MTIVELRPSKPTKPKRPARMVDALMDDAVRARIADDVVSRVREFWSYGDRVLIWKGIVREFRRRAESEREEPAAIARGLELLSQDVRRVMETRDAAVAESIAYPFELTDAAPTRPADILRFPSEPDPCATKGFAANFTSRTDGFES